MTCQQERIPRHKQRRQRRNQQHRRIPMIAAAVVHVAIMIAAPQSLVDGFSPPSATSSRCHPFCMRSSNPLLTTTSQRREQSENDGFDSLVETDEAKKINGSTSTTKVEFGDVVPLSRSSNNASQNAQFGDVVRLSSSSKPAPSTIIMDDTAISSSDAAGSANNDTDLATSTSTTTNFRSRNIIVAIASISLAIMNYFWQFTHPLSPVQVLFTLQQESDPISIVGTNSKPTIVDFWAPWCENCKQMAPTMELLHREYSNSMNFVMINADQRDSWNYIERFGVDAIPHMALVSNEGDVETAMIGLIPKSYLDADINVLLKNAAATTAAATTSATATDFAISASALCTASAASVVEGQTLDVSSLPTTPAICPPDATTQLSTNRNAPHTPLPYQMLDVFERHPELRRVSFPSK